MIFQQRSFHLIEFVLIRTIDQTILLSRLEYVLILDRQERYVTPLLRCSSHLSSRIQNVSIITSKSDPAPAPASYDALRGSVLGPGLLVLYTTLLSDIIEHHSVHHHYISDDTQLRKSAPTHYISECLQSMQGASTMSNFKY